MNWKRIYKAFMGLMLATVLFGCTAQPAAPAATTAPEATTAPATEVAPAATTAPAATEAPAAATEAVATPKTGGVLHMTMDQDPITSLDPTVPFNNSSIWTILNVYDQFYRVGKDGKSIDPDAAEKFEMSPDGLVYTIFIRKGLTFSDGTPVTIDDVVFSSERMLKSENWGFLFPAGTTVKAGDTENTVVFTLKQPNAPFINDLAGFWSSIVPKKLVEAQGDKFWTNPIGSGPFMIKEWQQGGTITLVRNPNYWDKPYPYLDEVQLALIPDDNARMTQFQAGELDVALSVPNSQIDAIGAINGAKVQEAVVYGVHEIDLMASHKPLDDIRVRQALAYATDKKALIDGVLFGHGEVANVEWPKVLFWTPDLGGYNFDLAKAKQLMKDAGYEAGFPITITYTAGDQGREQEGTILMDQWSKIGVTVKLEALDSTTLNDRYAKNELQVLLGGYTSDVIDPSELNFIYLCFYTKPRAGVCNDKVDALASQADQEMDPVKREALYHQLMQEATDWLINIPEFYYTSHTAVWDYVQDFKILPTANFRLWEVWLNK